jgi:hypothetical protein
LTRNRQCLIDERATLVVEATDPPSTTETGGAIATGFEIAGTVTTGTTTAPVNTAGTETGIEKGITVDIAHARAHALETEPDGQIAGAHALPAVRGGTIGEMAGRRDKERGIEATADGRKIRTGHYGSAGIGV